MHQLINEPTDKVPESSSCIDLIFVSHPIPVMKSGAYLPLH